MNAFRSFAAALLTVTLGMGVAHATDPLEEVATLAQELYAEGYVVLFCDGQACVELATGEVGTFDSELAGTFVVEQATPTPTDTTATKLARLAELFE